MESQIILEQEERVYWPLTRGQHNIRRRLGPEINSTLTEIETYFFTKAPLNAIKRYDNLIIKKT